jgi:hypothetical protein
LRSCVVFLWRYVSGFEMGGKEHTIDGVHNIPCGSGAFLPPAFCCLLSSLSSCLDCLVLEIGCGGIFGVDVVVVVVGLGAMAASFDRLLVRIRSLTFTRVGSRFGGGFELGFGGPGDVAEGFVNEMVVGGREMIDVAMQRARVFGVRNMPSTVAIESTSFCCILKVLWISG